MDADSVDLLFAKYCVDETYWSPAAGELLDRYHAKKTVDLSGQTLMPPSTHISGDSTLYRSTFRGDPVTGARQGSAGIRRMDYRIRLVRMSWWSSVNPRVTTWMTPRRTTLWC